jgi:peroxiredoxin
VRLAEHSDAFGRLGVRVFALARQPASDLQALQAKLGDGVTLLSDPQGAAVDRFGMRGPRLGIARAGLFHIASDGVVLQGWLPASYRHWPDPAAILAALR